MILAGRIIVVIFALGSLFFVKYGEPGKKLSGTIFNLLVIVWMIRAMALIS